MKHGWKITCSLLLLFFVSQLAGIATVYLYTGGTAQADQAKDLPAVFGVPVDRPESTEGGGILYVAFAIALGTLIVLVLLSKGHIKIWKAMILFAVFLTMNVTLGTLLPALIANILAAILAIIKLRGKSLAIHNFTELLMYSGFTVIFLEMFTVRSAALLLVLIALYDSYAVWKSKHMVKLASMQAESGVFAGLQLRKQGAEQITETEEQATTNSKQIRTANKTAAKSKAKRHEQQETTGSAVLGGGDMAFPLIFTAQVLLTKGLIPAIIVACSTTAALTVLLFTAKPNRFYPAMPYISFGAIGAYLMIVAL